MKILWLASWYPSRIEPFNGDFVQRHAEAASLYHDIHIIHVIKDPTGEITKTTHIEQRQKGRLSEQVVYYYNRFGSFPLVGRAFSALEYWKVFQKQIAAYLRDNGKPDLVHVHVCMKAGLLALWLKRKFGLAYVVTEHSTIFLREAEKNIFQQPFYFKMFCATVLKNADAITVVSHHLGKAVQGFVQGRTYEVIPNVVNTEFFFPLKEVRREAFEFIHISGLSYQKNFEAILDAVNILRTARTDFVLRVFGPHKEEWMKKIAAKGLKSFVIFYEEVPQPKLAKCLQKADTLILFSRYETFGCVLIEAAACGVPVVINDIPPMREIVLDNIGGLIVENNPGALAEALLQMVDKKIQFDAQGMAEKAEKNYGYKTVGQAFSAFYKAITSDTKVPLQK